MWVAGSGRLTKNQLAATAALTRTARVLPDGEYRSVFRPTPEQELVCGAAKERRGNIATSEWALLDTLGVQVSGVWRSGGACTQEPFSTCRQAGLGRPSLLWPTAHRQSCARVILGWYCMRP